MCTLAKFLKCYCLLRAVGSSSGVERPKAAMTEAAQRPSVSGRSAEKFFGTIFQ